MRFLYGKRFEKGLRNLLPRQRDKVFEQLGLFSIDEHVPVLNNHKLHGKYDGYWSINVTGDLRIIYRREKDFILLEEVGTHSQLY